MAHYTFHTHAHGCDSATQRLTWFLQPSVTRWPTTYIYQALLRARLWVPPPNGIEAPILGLRVPQHGCHASHIRSITLWRFALRLRVIHCFHVLLLLPAFVAFLLVVESQASLSTRKWPIADTWCVHCPFYTASRADMFMHLYYAFHNLHLFTEHGWDQTFAEQLPGCPLIVDFIITAACFPSSTTDMSYMVAWMHGLSRMTYKSLPHQMAYSRWRNAFPPKEGGCTLYCLTWIAGTFFFISNRYVTHSCMNAWPFTHDIWITSAPRGLKPMAECLPS